jgi:diguanylate cyclase (GGDEF)-like protein
MGMAEWWTKNTPRHEAGAGQSTGDGRDGDAHVAGADVPEDATDAGLPVSDHQRRLNVLALLLHSAGSVEDMLCVLAEKGPHVTGASVVCPLLLDKRRDVLHAKPLQGNCVPSLDTLSAALEMEVTELEFPLPAQGLRRRTLEGGEMETAGTLCDLFEDVVGKPACEAAQRALEPKCVVLAPMVMDGDPMGLIVFLFDEEEFDRELLELLTGHVTLALKNLTDLEEMGRFGEMDQVTWLYNRRYFTEAVEREILRSKRYRRPLSLIFLEIDRFSDFRDSYGPSLGDRLLRSVGMLLAESATEPEVVAHFEDSDFALLLPEVNRASAVSITTSLMSRLAQVAVFGGSGSPERVTASVVIVCYPEDGTTAHDLVAAAANGLGEARREKEAETPKPESPESASKAARRAS